MRNAGKGRRGLETGFLPQTLSRSFMILLRSASPVLLSVTFFALIQPYFVTFLSFSVTTASHFEVINHPFASRQPGLPGGYRQKTTAIGKKCTIYRSVFDRFLPIDSHAFGSSPVTVHFLVSSASSFSIAKSPASAECKASWIAASSFYPPSDQPIA